VRHCASESTYHDICKTATAAAALIIGTFINRPNSPTAATTTTTTTNHGCSHLVRLVPTRRSFGFGAISLDLKEGDPSLRIGRFTCSDMALAASTLSILTNSVSNVSS
jgi:hypothetical protein